MQGSYGDLHIPRNGCKLSPSSLPEDRGTMRSYSNHWCVTETGCTLDFEFWPIGESTVERSCSKGRKDVISKKGMRITTELCGAHVRDRPRLTIVPSTNLGAVVGRYDGHIYHLSHHSICDTPWRGSSKAGYVPLRCCIYPRGKFRLVIAISLGQ